MARLILDTGVLVAAVRGTLPLTYVADADDLALPAIVLAEYRAGSLADPDPGRSAAQQAFLIAVLEHTPIHPYDRTVADHHAELLAHVWRSGTRRGAHDLIVAATARAHDRVILTTDASAHFNDLPGVNALVVPP